MTDEEAVALGWTFAEETCTLCHQPVRVRVPPPHQRVDPGTRPRAEHEAANRTNELTREQTERRTNERV